MQIKIIPCLQDNYSYLLIDESNNSACVIDPSETGPIINFVDKTCDRYEIIAGQSYCIKKSNITLNSCGKKSDWPCMEVSGCLSIDHFVLNVIDE